MPYTPKTYTTQVTADDLSRAELGIQTAQAAAELAESRALVQPWVTGTSYKTGQEVSNGGTNYLAVNNHTAGATFAGDLAARWIARASAGTPANLPEYLVDNYFSATVTTDKAAAAAALAAATANSRGGVVRFGPRTYTLADWAPVLPSGLTKTVDIKGAGKIQTVLNFATDRGVGTWAIASDSDAVAAAVCYSTISDAWITGPATTNALGGTPSVMRGVRQTRRMRLERLVISGFHSGVQTAGDHTTMRDVDCSQNYYGLYFAQMATLFGDNLIENCDLTGNTFASIGIANDALASINMIGGHLGFCPYAIYGESGSSAALQLGGATFHRTSFEACGNGHIYSPDKSMRIDGVDFIACGFTRIPAYKLAANNADYGIYVNEFYRVNMRGCTIRDAWALGQINVTNAIGFFMDRAQSSWDAAVTAAVPFMIATGGTAQFVEVWTDRWKARGAVAAATLARGQLVGRNSLFMYVNGASAALDGVALNDANATNLRVCFACYEGEDVYVLAGATIAAGNSLVVSSTDRTKVSGELNTDAATTRRLIGHPYSGDGSTGNLQAHVRI